MDEVVRTTIRRSLLRPQLILGGERELVFMSGMLAAIMIFSLGNIVTGAIGVIFWGACLAVFQRMAKYDPQLTKVYVRHVNKKLFYPARPHWSALEPEPKKHQ